MADSSQRRWTPVELSVLERRRAEKVSPRLIAEELGRTLSSVTMRCQIDNVRKCQRRIRETREPVRENYDDDVRSVVPPVYVRRERDIRLSIPAVTVTQVVFADPVEGYSALATKSRKISVQDALEICALRPGLVGGDAELARMYEVSILTIRRILNGSFFERLLPSPYLRAGERTDD